MNDPPKMVYHSTEILELVEKHKGTGIVKNNKKGEWDRKETIIDNDKVIGMAVNNLTGKTVSTTVFRIHYGDNGVHIVPDYPSKKKKW